MVFKQKTSALKIHKWRRMCRNLPKITGGKKCNTVRWSLLNFMEIISVKLSLCIFIDKYEVGCKNFDRFCENLQSGPFDGWMDVKFNSKTHLQKSFFFFRAIPCAFGFKDCKKCSYVQNICFHNISIWESENPKFDADFKKFTRKG